MRTGNLIAVIITLGILGCGQNNNGSRNIANGNFSEDNMIKAIGKPVEYIPTEIGKELNYVITLGEVEPLQYEEVIWPMGDRRLVYATRGRFSAAIKTDGKDIPSKFALNLKVKGHAEKQGGLEFPIGIELSVEKDELGVYEDAKQVFLAASESGRFTCHEVVTHEPGSIGSPTGQWGHWGSEDGYSMRLYFFGSSPYTSMGLGNDPSDRLLFKGIANVPNTNTKGLYFVRTVNPPKREKDSSVTTDREGILSKGFEEHMYFVRSKGLVYLQQRIENKVSMTWRMSGM